MEKHLLINEHFQLNNESDNCWKLLCKYPNDGSYHSSVSDFAALVVPSFDHPSLLDDDEHAADYGDNDDNDAENVYGDKDGEGLNDVMWHRH